MKPSKGAHFQAEKEERLKNACNELRQAIASGSRVNIKGTSRKYDVPYTTLLDRFHGTHVSAHSAHARRQLLSPTQEAVLVEWIDYLDGSGHPVSKQTIKQKVFALTGKHPGKKWVERFLVRHENISLGRPSRLDPKRATAFNPTTVAHHFSLLESILKKYGIPWENVYNMDEKGCQRGGGRGKSRIKYLLTRREKHKLGKTYRGLHYKFQSDNLELVTVIECVCADGTSLQPGFVFSGKQFHPEWFQVNPDICMSTSANGWTDDFLGTEWFRKCFIPQATQRNSSGKPILLVYDGHRSHLVDQIRELALEHNIHLYCLPPKTTHMLQPLDVGVFGPLQTAWSRRCETIVAETGCEMPVEDFVKEYMGVRDEVFTSSLITSAWQKCGLAPINPDIFTEDDFAPAKSSSIKCHFPSSFPAHSESSDNSDATSSDEDPDFTDGSSMESESSESEGGEMVGVEVGGEDGDEDSVRGEHANRDRDIIQHTPDSLSITPHARIHHPINDDDEPSYPLSPTMHHSESQSHRQTRSMVPSSSSTPHYLYSLPFKSHWSLAHKYKALLARNNVLIEAHKMASQNLDAAEAHCALARAENEELKRRLNGKSERKKRERMLASQARCLTSEEGLREWEAQKAKDAEKASEKQAKRARHEAKQLADREARAARGPVLEFKGSLASKNLGDLQELANALQVQLPSATKRVTKQILVSEIKAYLDHNPSLKDDPRFTKLFTDRSSRGQKRARVDAPEDDENDVPPAVRPHLPPATPTRSHFRDQSQVPFSPSRTLNMSTALSSSVVTPFDYDLPPTPNTTTCIGFTAVHSYTIPGPSNGAR